MRTIRSRSELYSFLTCSLALALCATAIARSALAQPRVPNGFVDEVIVRDLDQPVGMAWLPDGRLLVIEQRTGALRLVLNGTATTLFTVPEVNADANERGLLGIAVDPAFPTRPYVYVYFSHPGPPPTNHVEMFALRGDLTDPASGALEVDAATRHALLIDIPDNAGNHNAGSLRFDPAGQLYIQVRTSELPLSSKRTAILSNRRCCEFA